jgi:hypothetical protein
MSDDLDPRWTGALRRHRELTAADGRAWQAIRDRAEAAVPLRPIGRRSTGGRRLWAIAAAALVVVAAAGALAWPGRDRTQSVRSTDRPSAAAPEDGRRYEGTGVVLQTWDHGPVLCGWLRQYSPPRCDGAPIVGWDWAEVTGEASRGDVRWGRYRMVVTFDGERLRLTEPATFVSLDLAGGGLEPDAEPGPPCPVPAGGWTVTDPTKVGPLDSLAMRRAAEAEPDFAAWWFNGGPVDPTKPDPPASGVYVVAFTGDLDRHEADLRALWGGPLCVIERADTRADLLAAEEAANRDLRSGRFPGTEDGRAEVDELGGQILVAVLAAPDGFEADLEERHGVPFKVSSVLRPRG